MKRNPFKNRCKGKRGCSYVRAKSDSDFKGEWITDWIECESCVIQTTNKVRTRKTNGWEMSKHLVYCDFKYRLWVCTPGYLWDGPSYPSAKRSIVGKTMRFLVGNRKKKGLLASSAQHDQMAAESFVMETNARKLPHLKRALEKDTLNKYFKNKEYTKIKLSIHEAAHLYKDMLNQWPDRGESITKVQAFKQFLGLLVFQPWYRLFIVGPGMNDWTKIEE